ncbi:MAG: LysR family transcriptional regulator [Pseudorhodobacter sp.]|nr:LysR family transcriptional regulator [Pseudorhodobacter sp.]
MDWDDLRIFLAVARAESLSGAGKTLRLDPATIGRRIQRLEVALSARLFAKSPQGYTLTDEGAKLMEPALRAETALSAVADELGQAQSGLTGQIRLGAPDGCANYLLPAVLTQICTANPGLEVQIVALPRVFNLSRREADMAIAVSRPETGRLTVQKLSDYHLHLAASRTYLAGSPPITGREDLQKHRIVGYIADMIFDKELDYLREIGATQPALASNSVPVQVNLLRAGAGVGMVHDFALPSAPELIKILPDEITLTRAFWLIRHADDGRVERLSRFADLLVQGFRAELARLEALS